MRIQIKRDLLLAVMCISSSWPVFAEQIALNEISAKLDVNKSPVENLKSFIGKNVGIIEQRGILYFGNLKQISDKNVIIEDIHNKKIRQILIRSSNIIGIQVKIDDAAENAK